MQGIREFWRRFFGPNRDRGLRGGVDPHESPANSPATTRVGGSSSTPTPVCVIVGLGNPGARYAATRHNIGFRVVELLAERHGGEWHDEPQLDARICSIDIESESCVLAQPRSFMNRSGSVALALLERWSELDPASDLLIIYDDLDLPTGRLRLRPEGGGGGHRGIGDILDALDSKEIARLRVGVGRPDGRKEVIDWVLEPFSAEEESLVLPDLLDRAADAVEMTIREGLSKAMGQFNQIS